MPISSTYRQTGKVVNQPWNTTKPRRLSSTLPPSEYSSRKDDTARSVHSNTPRYITNSSDNTKYPKKPCNRDARPAWMTGSIEKPLFELSQPIASSTSPQSRRTLKRRETLPDFSELSLTPLTEFKRSNSDSSIGKPCEPGKRKVGRALLSQRTSNYRMRLEDKSVPTRIREKKVDSEAKVPANSKICLNDYHQTPKELGQRIVCVLNKHIRSGVVHYLGATHFSEGQWCGIVLDEPCGKNDGCVKGIRYFSCSQNYGIFVHVQKVRAIDRGVLDTSHNTLTDGLQFKESEDKLTFKNSPKNSQYKQKLPTSCSGAAVFKQSYSSDNCNSGCLTSKTRSKSFSHGAKLNQSGEESAMSDSNGDVTRMELSRCTSLPKFTGEERVCPQENIEDNSKCIHSLQNDTNIDSNKSVNNGLVLDEQNSQAQSCCGDGNDQQDPKSYNLCSIHHRTSTSNCEDVMTTAGTQTNLHNGFVSTHVTMTTGQRSYSSDYISNLERKSRHNLNNPGPHAALERDDTIDAFVQDKYCSCPILVPSQHLSSALETCIDLGRQELESHSENNFPIEEEKIMDMNRLHDTERHAGVESNSCEPDINKDKLPYHGCCKSLPLVLVPVRNISETESLFWSADKLSGLVFKEERSVSWPTLSTSACRLDLRPDNKLSEAENIDSLNTDHSVKSNKGMLTDETEKSDFDDDKQDTSRVFVLKKKGAVENLVQSDTESLSQSGSQVSLSSGGTSGSRKGRKVSASSASSSRSQTKKVTSKPQRNSKMNHKLQEKKIAQMKNGKNGNRNGKNAENSASPVRLVKRHTVSNLQTYQPNLSGTTRPSVTKRPTSALTEPAFSAVSPSYGKSKLPTIKKIQLTVSSKPARPSKPPVKTTAIRPVSIALQDIKKVPGPTTEKQTLTQRKPTTPSSQKPTKKVESTVKKRTKVTSKPGQQSGPDKKTPTTSTTIANKPKLSVKPSTPQDTTGSPSSKPASSPSRHYHSRLPRKIPSRDASIESSQSHDCDTASIGTEESDYLDGERLYRGDSFPVDQYDADRSDLESSTRSWQCAPDILTGTREIHTRSVEVQVEPDEDQTVEDIQHKYLQLERLLHGMKKDCHDLELAVADRDSNLLSSVILIVALCKKLQNNCRLIVHMKKDLHLTESELKQFQERLAEEESNAVQLQEEMMYVRSEHTVAVQNLKADHENTLESLRYSLNKQYAEQHVKANEEHVKELLELNKVHEEKEAEIEKRHGETVAEVNEKYEDEIVELESKHSQHVDELLEEHQVEIETIKTDYEEQHGGLESKMFTVTNECTSLNMKLQRLQEETERDIETRIQEAIEKYKALPNELESMKCVLDMKNEENKHLKKEKMEAQMELDHLRNVTERMKKLEHENESLSFVVENKSKFERQLSVEHEQLKTTLDRESKKLKRLSLENEELQWKLYNTPSPTEETASSDFSVNGSPTRRRSFRLSSCSHDVDTINE